MRKRNSQTYPWSYRNHFDYAKAMGYFEGDNPAEWKGNLEPILGNLKQESRPHPSLPYEQVAEFIHHLRQKKEFHLKLWDLQF